MPGRHKNPTFEKAKIKALPIFALYFYLFLILFKNGIDDRGFIEVSKGYVLWPPEAY